MITQTLTVKDKVGLHARPATLFVKAAAQFKSNVQVRNLSRNTAFVTAKSILRVLSLGVEQNHQIELSAEGEDAQAAIDAISALINTNFGEPE